MCGPGQYVRPTPAVFGSIPPPICVSLVGAGIVTLMATSKSDRPAAELAYDRERQRKHRQGEILSKLPEFSDLENYELDWDLVERVLMYRFLHAKYPTHQNQYARSLIALKGGSLPGTPPGSMAPPITNVSITMTPLIATSTPVCPHCPHCRGEMGEIVDVQVSES